MNISKNEIIEIIKPKSFRSVNEGKAVWLLDEKIFGYEITISDNNGEPCQKDIDSVVYVLNNLEEIERDCLSYIKSHLSIESSFSLHFMEFFGEPDRHDVDAILMFWCDAEAYLYVEVGLMKYKPHYILLKYW